MKLWEAVKALEEGCHVMTGKGSVFHLDTDKRGEPVLVANVPGLSNPVKHSVLSSYHFNCEWRVVQ